jgi:signal transduction histidine kinase
VLEVADQGKGIAPDQRARIFEPFYRVNPGIAPRGSGLGLAVVRHVAEAHGGSVRVEPVPGGGSRFILRLPREIEPAGGGREEDA